jgi:hypothetical protein
VDHAEKYVDGQVHVNGVENFWSPLFQTRSRKMKNRRRALIALKRSQVKPTAM